MLSRVIAFRDAMGLEAAPFHAAPLTHATSGPGWPGSPIGSPEAELRLQELAAECARVTAENKALLSRATGLEQEVEGVRKQAFDAGIQQGEQRAHRELVPIVEKMKQAISDTIGARSTLRASAEKDVVQLAVQIAKRILHRELATDPNALSALAKVVFDRMTRSEGYTLTLHPRFLEAVQASLTGNSGSRVRIEPDPGCAPGTFIVRSEEGTIDASVEAQLDEIARGLADRLAEG